MLKLGAKCNVDIVNAWDQGIGHLAFCRNSSKRGYKWQANRFFHCRDRFQERFRKSQKHILFMHRAGERARIVRFMHQVEAKLGLGERSQTRFGPTQRHSITWVAVSPFWRESPMRRSLFTALLRAGRSYRNKAGFRHALFSVPYTNSTQDAVNRFLEGFTHYRGREASGWQAAFTQQGEYRFVRGSYNWVPHVFDLNRVLVKPPKKKKKVAPVRARRARRARRAA